MSRGFDFLVAGVVTIIAVIIHTIGIELLAPGTALYGIATNGTAVMHGQARADLWYEILSLWVPLLSFAGVWAWVFVNEYRRQAVTAVRRPG